MKITAPAENYTGRVAVGAYALNFLAGVAHDTNIPGPERKALEEAGYKFEDDRPGRGTDTDEDAGAGDQPAT